MAEPATALYLYCVVGRDAQPPLERLVGVEGAPVTAIAEGELCALASPVPLAVFGEAPLRRQLEEIRWVERVARAHDGVLTDALACEAVLPLRMCTIFTRADAVRAWLARDRGPLLAALARLRGRAEWSVKVRVDLARLEAKVGAAAGAPPRSDGEGDAGRAFFARKRAERAVRQRALALATTVVDELHGRLCAVASAARLLPPQRRELSRLPGTMVHNGAYLVARDQVAGFSAVVSALAARHHGAGFEIDVSGPWAPYNFASTGAASDERRPSASGHAAA